LGEKGVDLGVKKGRSNWQTRLVAAVIDEANQSSQPGF